jgi:hypothetical protein
MNIGDEDYAECDSDLEVEMDRKNMERDDRIERIKMGKIIFKLNIYNF